MKLTIDRKELLSVLKSLKAVSSKAPADQEDWKDVLSLQTLGDRLIVSAGFGGAFISVEMDCEVKAEGACNVSYKLLDLVKALHDDTLTLTLNKVLSIAGSSGFKATLNDKLMRQTLPIVTVRQYLDQGIDSELVLDTEEVLNLVDISKAFTPIDQWQELNIKSDGTGVQGWVQKSEDGGLDEYPMQGQGDHLSVCVSPVRLAALLQFCGSRTKIGLLKASNGFVLLTDPDNDSWWGIVVQISRRNNIVS